MLTINALAATDSVVIPTQPHYLSAKGLELLLRSASMVRRQINPKLRIDGILMTMVMPRTNISKEITATVKSAYGQKIKVFDIAGLPLGFIGEMGSGKIRRIVNDSSAATETYLAHQLPDMAGAIATPLGMIVMLFLFDWRFGLICLVPVVLGFTAMFKMAGPKMADDMKNYQNALADMNNEAVEYVRGIPVVKTFGQTVHTFKRFKGSIDNYYKFCISYCKKCRMPMLLYTVCINSAFAFLITLALILTGGESVIQSILLNFIFYVIFTPVIATSMSKVLYMSENGMVVADALERVHSILNMKPLPNAVKNNSPKDNSVEFRNVSFRYSGAETDALQDVSFKVQSGETIALVGSSGGGKTTVAGLISRFWDVSAGEIKIGGVNVKKSKIRAYGNGFLCFSGQQTAENFYP